MLLMHGMERYFLNLLYRFDLLSDIWQSFYGIFCFSLILAEKCALIEVD